MLETTKFWLRWREQASCDIELTSKDPLKVRYTSFETKLEDNNFGDAGKNSKLENVDDNADQTQNTPFKKCLSFLE